MMAALVALVCLGLGGTALAITHRPGPATPARAALTPPGCDTASSTAPRLAGIHPQFVTLAGMPFAVTVTGNGRWSFVSTGVGRSIEVLRDSAQRLLPASRTEIRAMLDELQASALLHRARPSGGNSEAG